MKKETLTAEYILGSWTVDSVNGPGPGIEAGAKFFVVSLGNGKQYQLRRKEPENKFEWNAASINLDEIYESKNGVTYLLSGKVTYRGSTNTLQLGTNDEGKSNLTILVETPGAGPGAGPGGGGNASRP